MGVAEDTESELFVLDPLITFLDIDKFAEDTVSIIFELYDRFGRTIDTPGEKLIRVGMKITTQSGDEVFSPAYVISLNKAKSAADWLRLALLTSTNLYCYQQSLSI
jgi:hypothetical protein